MRVSRNGEGHVETIERYCYVIGKNTLVNRCMADGNVRYECVNRHICEKDGRCDNGKYCGGGTAT